MPILLERYLELGVRVGALSIDPSFGHRIDTFVVVDLDKVPTPLLKRFMGLGDRNAMAMTPYATRVVS